MRLPLDWLGSMVDLGGLNPDEIARALTLGLCEVEKVEKPSVPYRGVVVGKIHAVAPHPQADRLRLATVSAGGARLQIVCGAPNIAPGQTVPVALLGAELPGEDGKSFTIKKSKIRGVESEGMLCSQEELGLGRDQEGILLLDGDLKEGTSLEQALGGPAPVLVVDNKSLTHRADCWGLRGLAREAAVILQRKLNLAPLDVETLSGPSAFPTEVLSPQACPLYRLAGISGVRATESPPLWKARLESAGMRPVNAIVDATNLAMLETAQPLHAFDAAKVKGPVRVRLAREGEGFTTLDGVTRSLAVSDLVICDGDTPIALAGVMGGASTAVTASTTSILLEGALFDAATLRRTSSLLGLRSESSARYEKSLPSVFVGEGMARCLDLLREVFPQLKITHGIASPPTEQPRRLRVECSWLSSRLGTKLEASVAAEKLRGLGFTVDEREGTLEVGVPPWRTAKDISLPEDLLEEVARLLPLEAIPARLPLRPARPATVAAERVPERRLRRVLSSCGAREVLSYSFSNAFQRQWVKEETTGDLLRGDVRNPIQSDMHMLRKTMVAGLLTKLERNLHQRDAIHLFEIGRTYRLETDNAQERRQAAGLLKGLEGDRTWHAARRDVEAVLKSFHVSKVQWRKDDETSAPSWAHPGRSSEVLCGKLSLGRVAEIHPKILGNMGAEGRAAAWELDLEVLRKVSGGVSSFRELPRYPGVRRDLALLVPDSVSVAEVEALFSAGKRPHLDKVELFDIYRGKGLVPGTKSLAFRLHWLDPERTMTDERIRELEAALVGECQARGWTRR